MERSVIFIDRLTGLKKEEKVMTPTFLSFLYGGSVWGRWVHFLTTRFSLVSRLVGAWMRLPFTRRKIGRFVLEHEIDPIEFAKPLESFKSFNDFFIRKLRPEVRPIAPGDNILVCPTDGRYAFYPSFSSEKEVLVKGHHFSLEKLVGTKCGDVDVVVVRLCPSDYHRFHFPCEGVASAAREVKGQWQSVHPIALRVKEAIFTENKRMVTSVESKIWGEVLMVEVGATCVGTIHQTYQSGESVSKGQEKGYFSFGGSAMVLIFEAGKVQFEPDCLSATEAGYEIRCLMGQRMGSFK